MSAFGVTVSVADQLLDMSTLTVANVNQVAWHTIGRFYRAHFSLFHGKVVSLPLSGDFLSLFYRTDVFEAYGMRVPRTLKEYVFASQVLNGTDLNGDGEEDDGSCMSHAGRIQLKEPLMSSFTPGSLRFCSTAALPKGPCSTRTL